MNGLDLCTGLINELSYHALSTSPEEALYNLIDDTSSYISR